MSVPAHGRGPELEELYNLFGPDPAIPDTEVVPADRIPQPYHRLLVHEHHMTVTVEAHHGDLVDVRVLGRVKTPDSYARMILLALHGTGKVVQFGIMRVRLRYCSQPVRDEILDERTPLGRILIQHNVLRRIQPTAYLRVGPNAALGRWFGLDTPRQTYGRLAYIYCDGQPAIELLEIVAPE